MGVEHAQRPAPLVVQGIEDWLRIDFAGAKSEPLHRPAERLRFTCATSGVGAGARSGSGRGTVKARPHVFDGHHGRLVQSVGRDALGRRIESTGRLLKFRHDSGSAPVRMRDCAGNRHGVSHPLSSSSLERIQYIRAESLNVR